MTRTLVVGLDAATWRIAEQLVEEGRLPNLASLCETGASGPLESTLPPMTPPAWTSMATGVNPGKHGIYDFLRQDADTYQIEPTDYTDLSWPALWNVFDAHDRSVGVVNYPMAMPAPEVDGCFVSGIPAPDEGTIAHPKSVQNLLDEYDYRVTPQAGPEDGANAYFESVRRLTDRQCAVSLELLERFDVELFWTVFMGIDWVQHYLWNETVDGENAVDRFYEYIDGKLRELLDAVDDECRVLVVSDHGAREIEGEIHMNTLLERWGYVTRQSEAATQPLTTRITDRVLATLWALGTRLPAGLKRQIKDKLASEQLTEIRAAAGVSQLDLHTSFDWAQTTAFSYGYMGRVFIHDIDRYHDGQISSERYESVQADLIDRLESATHPETGAALVETALPGESVYEGDQVADAPDVVFIPTDWRYMVYGDFDDQWIHDPTGRVADHDREGIFVLDGPDVRETGIEPHVTDIAPTLLALHDLPPVAGTDGTVLVDALTTSFETPPAVEPDELWDRNGSAPNAASDSVEDRLSDLGYLN